MSSPEKECQHENWEVRQDNLVGCGYCLDCDKQIYLSVLFNNLRQRMEAVIKKTEEKDNV